MTRDERPPHVGPRVSGESMDLPPRPDRGTGLGWATGDTGTTGEAGPTLAGTTGLSGPAGPSGPPSAAASDQAPSLEDLVARLTVVYPSVDPSAVQAAVRAAHDHFEQARVRAYVPILVERRSRKALDSALAAAPGRVPGVDTPGPEPEPVGDRRQEDDGTVGMRGRAATGFGG
jgi:hypothetical protein